jgi:mono/diheme cytochrome c family protein
VLKDAGGTGQIGPALDGNANMTRDFVISRVANGQGAMPGFGGLMSDEEIAVLADYIVATKQ